MPNAEECTTLLMETMPRLMRGFGAAMRQAQDEEETLTPGQMAVVNDTQIFHARTPFIDFNGATEVYDFALEPGNRLMERTWITRHRA